VSELKRCCDCNGYQGPFSSLTCTQPKADGDHFKGFECWHPIGTAKVWEERQEGTQEGTQDALQEALP